MAVTRAVGTQAGSTYLHELCTTADRSHTKRWQACGAGVALPYPKSTFALEFASVLLYFIVDAARINLGSTGNRSESIAPLLMMIALSLPLLGFYVYYLLFQVYVYVASSLSCVVHGFCCLCT
jgi:Predicted membrane protein